MERRVASGEGTHSFLELGPMCSISQGGNCFGCTEFCPQEGKAGRVCKMNICLSLMVSVMNLYQEYEVFCVSSAMFGYYSEGFRYGLKTMALVFRALGKILDPWSKGTCGVIVTCPTRPPCHTHWHSAVMKRLPWCSLCLGLNELF